MKRALFVAGCVLLSGCSTSPKASRSDSHANHSRSAPTAAPMYSAITDDVTTDVAAAEPSAPPPSTFADFAPTGPTRANAEAAPAFVPASQQKISLPGSEVEFDDVITSTVGGKRVSMVLTGAALRKKFFVNVYSIGSYVDSQARVDSAGALAAADVPKQLLLVMERDVPAADMAEAVKGSITANYSEREFPNELREFLGFLRGNQVHKGDRIWITNVPGSGLRCEIAGKNAIDVNSIKLSRAVWDIYLGPNNLGPAIKQGLTSRL